MSDQSKSQIGQALGIVSGMAIAVAVGYVTDEVGLGAMLFVALPAVGVAIARELKTDPQ